MVDQGVHARFAARDGDARLHHRAEPLAHVGGQSPRCRIPLSLQQSVDPDAVRLFRQKTPITRQEFRLFRGGQRLASPPGFERLSGVLLAFRTDKGVHISPHPRCGHGRFRLEKRQNAGIRKSLGQRLFRQKAHAPASRPVRMGGQEGRDLRELYRIARIVVHEPGINRAGQGLPRRRSQIARLGPVAFPGRADHLHDCPAAGFVIDDGRGGLPARSQGRPMEHPYTRDEDEDQRETQNRRLAGLEPAPKEG